MSRPVTTFGALTLLACLSSCMPQLCNTNAECDDGYWCNGEELCNLRPITLRSLFPELLVGLFGFTRGQCTYAEAPCCPMGIDCSVFSHVAFELCNEEEMQCEVGDECQIDEECNDGIWCNGDEFCASNFCFHAFQPYSFLETCNEGAMQCEETNRGACFRVNDLCLPHDQITERTIAALLLGMTDVPEDITILGHRLCNVLEVDECDWSAYADCVIANVTCETLESGRPEVALAACLDILGGNGCFITVNSSE